MCVWGGGGHLEGLPPLKAEAPPPPPAPIRRPPFKGVIGPYEP